MRKGEKVCVIVVTYNRKNLLLECLEALKKQTRPLDAIYLVDNASTDGTPELLKENKYITELPPKILTEPWEKEFEINDLVDREPIKFFYLRMHKNTGGAGGFYEGIKRGYKGDYDWLWLMDDDTVPLNNALEELLIHCKMFDNIGFLCSKVLWKDSSIHMMNVPQIKPIINRMPFNLFEEKGVLLVDGCSFVSCLINRKSIQLAGFPIKEFFIWLDDIEYTQRIISYKLNGFYVSRSVVIHKTKNNYSADILSKEVFGEKVYYGTRNSLYLSKRNNFMKYIIKLITNIIIIFPKMIFKKKNLKDAYYFIRGCLASIFFNPKIENKLLNDSKDISIN